MLFGEGFMVLGRMGFIVLVFGVGIVVMGVLVCIDLCFRFETGFLSIREYFFF